MLNSMTACDLSSAESLAAVSPRNHGNVMCYPLLLVGYWCLSQRHPADPGAD
jgi:hypothetical protein